MYSAGGMEEKSKAGAKVGGTGTKPPFTGVCKKDLAGAVIVHSSDVQDMSRQYRTFYDRVVVAAGKVGSPLVTAIKRKKILTLAHFKPIKPDPGEWTNEEGTDDRHDGSCWICGKMGHRQYKCPSLSQEERRDIRKMTMNEVAVFFEKKQKKYRAKKGGDDTVDNIEAAVHAVLGQYVDGTEDKKDKVFDDTDSDEDDDSTESYLNTFSFCQISVGNPGVNNDMESSGIPGVQRLWDHEESGEIPGVQGLCEDGSVTSKINSG